MHRMYNINTMHATCPGQSWTGSIDDAAVDNEAAEVDRLHGRAPERDVTISEPHAAEWQGGLSDKTVLLVLFPIEDLYETVSNGNGCPGMGDGPGTQAWRNAAR